MVNLSERILKFTSYLECLKLCNTLSLGDVSRFIDDDALGKKSLSACFAVIYPKHNWRLSMDVSDYRGPVRFSRRELPGIRCNCELERIWDYKCNNPLGCDDIQYDHLWPYALGGATNVDNLIALCPFHNFIKLNDYHWFPFESFSELPSWVVEQVMAIRKHL
jgi:5-methylcytosine-specific restriction endonuclease McrA